MRWMGLVPLLLGILCLPPATPASPQDDGGGNQQGGFQGGDTGGLNFQSQELNVGELMNLILDKEVFKAGWKDQGWDTFIEFGIPIPGAFGDGSGMSDTSWVDECDK